MKQKEILYLLGSQSHRVWQSKSKRLAAKVMEIGCQSHGDWFSKEKQWNQSSYRVMTNKKNP